MERKKVFAELVLNSITRWCFFCQLLRKICSRQLPGYILYNYNNIYIYMPSYFKLLRRWCRRQKLKKKETCFSHPLQNGPKVTSFLSRGQNNSTDLGVSYNPSEFHLFIKPAIYKGSPPSRLYWSELSKTVSSYSLTFPARLISSNPQSKIISFLLPFTHTPKKIIVHPTTLLRALFPPLRIKTLHPTIRGKISHCRLGSPHARRLGSISIWKFVAGKPWDEITSGGRRTLSAEVANFHEPSVRFWCPQPKKKSGDPAWMFRGNPPGKKTTFI